MFDNFQFDLIGELLGYNSSRDKTKIKRGYYIHGSQNVYKKRSGTVANRPGLKTRGATDATQAGVKSAYVYRNSLGAVRPLRVSNNKLQVESDLVTPGTLLWYDLLETSTLLNPARSLSRFVFTTWWETFEGKNRVVFCRGDNNLLHWSGGMTQVASGTAAVAGVIDFNIPVVVTAAGTGYAVGDTLTISTGNNNATLRVATLSGSGVATVTVLNQGSGYSIGSGQATTSTGAGTGCTVQILSVLTAGTITKLNLAKTFAQDGFATYFLSEKKMVINGIEYTYQQGEGTTTLQAVTPDPSGIVSGQVAIQSVMVQVSLDPTDPLTNYNVDFVSTLTNQLMVGSYTANILYISADVTVGTALGMTNFTDSGTHVLGDPDFLIVDDPPTGMIPRDGKMYISAGSGDWYEVTLNVSLPVSVGSPAAFVYTKVDKIPGIGLSGAYSHEFITIVGNTIVYLAKDQQLRSLGAFRNVFATSFPILSQDVFDELPFENFILGAIAAIGDYIYLTAPATGRHWLYQIRENVDNQGNVTAERLWHPPFVAGISRIVEIGGIVYGYSTQNPMCYQLWDTNQWHDDSPSGNLPYTSILKIAYRQLQDKRGIDRVATGRFDKAYFEGYMSNGTNLYANIYFDYQGASGLQNVIINSVAKPAIFYQGSDPIALGQSPLGDNPLGDGLVLDTNEQELLPKFRSINDINPVDSFEHAIEIYSNDADARWEILDLGTNIQKSPTQPVELRKSS